MTGSRVPAAPNERHAWITVVSFLALALAAAYFIPFAPVMPTGDVDPSWAYGMNQGYAQRLVLGRDLMFTMGPLASVFTRLYHPATDTSMLLGSALVALGWGAGMAVLVWPRRIPLLIVLPVVVAVASSPDARLMALPFLLLLAVLRLCVPPGSRFHLEPGPAAVAGIAVLAAACGILPLIKGSFLGAAVGELGLAVLATLLARRFGLSALIAVVPIASLCIVWIATHQPIGALPDFFRTLGHMISGYSEAMSLDSSLTLPAVWLVAPVALAYLTWIAPRTDIGPWRWIGLLGLAGYAFVVFKAAFVRQIWHPVGASETLLLLAVELAACVASRRGALAILVIGVLGWGAVERGTGYLTIRTVPMRVADAFDGTIQGLAVRLGHPDALRTGFDQANAAIRAEVSLPAVKGSADLYPTDLSALFANGIPWSGRPIIQSYSAYDLDLEEANAAHLTSPAAPDNIFFAIMPIDGRIPALDDALSWPALLGSYRLIGATPTYLHLVRVAAPALTPIGEPAAQIVARVGDAIPIPVSNDPLWATIDMKPTGLGKATLSLYKLPRVLIEITLDNGRTVRNRFIPSIGREGFLLSPYVGTTADFAMLAAGLPAHNAVRGIKLIAPDSTLWGQDVTVVLRPLTLPAPTAEARAIALSEPTVPPAAIASALQSEEADCSVNFIDGTFAPEHRGAFSPNGPALFILGSSALSGGTPRATWVALRDAGGQTRFYKTGLEARTDFAIFDAHPDMRGPAFGAYLDLAGLHGTQSLTLYAVDGNRAWKCREGLTLDLPPG